jgi:hypothetical protein
VTHLNEEPVARPLDLAAAVDDEVTMGVLIVHGQLYQDLGVLAMVQVCQVAVVICYRLHRGLGDTILQHKHG